jgi:hypothetical protein
MRAGLSHDARAVADSTSPARRHLRPEPQPLALDDTLTAPGLPDPSEATTEIIAVPSASVPRRRPSPDGDGSDTAIFPARRGPSFARPRSDDLDALAITSGGVGTLTDGDGAPTGPAPGRLPIGEPAPAITAAIPSAPVGGESHAPQRLADRRVARARGEGVVVPLHVPWQVRVRATAGLFILIVFMGIATAALVAAVVVLTAQALGSL